MNVVDAGSLYATLALWLAAAIVIAVAATYVLRPRTRAHFPGGNGRYLLATAIQAAGFMIPIPLVVLVLLGPPTPDVLDVMLSVVAGVAVVFALRAAPVTGPLLRDLHRARLEAAMERLGPRT